MIHVMKSKSKQITKPKLNWADEWFEDMENRMVSGELTMPVKCFWCKNWYLGRCNLGNDPFKKCNKHKDVQIK